MAKKQSETLYLCPGFGREPHSAPESEFYWNMNGGRIRRSHQCKECSKSRKREYWRETYYPAHREAQIEATIRNRKARAQKPKTKSARES